MPQAPDRGQDPLNNQHRGNGLNDGPSRGCPSESNRPSAPRGPNR